MVFLSRALMVLLAAVALPVTALAAQDSSQSAYFRAVADFFQVAETEIAILGHGGEVPPDEMPVVLFMARRGGVSAEAVVALRESGRSWTELAQRFGVGANVLHVPMRDGASMGTLTAAYDRFRATPMDQWSAMPLEGGEIVALVNVRVLSRALGVEPDQIAARTGSGGTFVELYGQFLR